MTEQPSAVVLAVDALSVAFAGQDRSAGPPVTVVDQVSFELERGRVLALVGESGSGKSVTAMSILGLLPPNAQVSGSATLEGDELIGAVGDQLRRVRGCRIGTIFQEPMTAFNPVYKVGWQIEEAIRSHDRSAGRAARAARVGELLRSVGLTDAGRIADSYPHQLSGGQLQRAMIAMAISCDPVALIADEPTTALDVTVQAGILDLIRSLRDERGTAVLLITHDMGVVADLADDVVVMRQGLVVERARASEVFAAPTADYTRALLDAVPRLEQVALRTCTCTERATGSVTAESDAPRDAVAAMDGVRIVYGASGWGRKPVVAVDGVSLSIGRGRTLGLVGESGSGKSTIGRAFAGLVPVREGSVTVADVDLARATRRELRDVRRTIGYVFQDPTSSLNPRFSVERVIAEPMRLLSDMAPDARRARVAELLDAVGLPAATAQRFPHELSGGQRQRVAIARAIALEPKFLIADEPTSALDVSVQARVLELLGELSRRFGFSCLFVSHDLAVVQELADEVVVMRAGRIVEAGPVGRVLTAPEHPYTRRLLAAVPVPDPAEQRARRDQWREMAISDDLALVSA